MLQIKTQDQASVMIKRLQKSQSTGFIQLDNLELSIFPKEVPNIQELRFDTQKWWDIVPITKLDLSNNKIKEIPEEIANLNDLVSFRMQNNALESLPESLFMLQSLKSVDFGNNKLKSLPPTFIKCITLVEAVFRHNQLEVLPTHYGGLASLEILDLSENNIRTFRMAEGDLPRLKRLDLSQNQITSLDTSLGSLRELESINLSKNKIAELPPGVFRDMRNLKLLDLKENRLTSFGEFPQTTKLDSVILSFNQLKRVYNFGNVPNLTVLDLKNNKLATLDPELSLLKELKTLDISNNDLSDVPNEVGFMTKLVRISLEGNALKSIRSSVRFSGAEALKKYLRERTDVNQNSTGIVQEFNKVAVVDVWDQFTKDFLVGGKELTVNGQNIPVIHDKFCSLNLTLLDLSNNKISEINPNLSKLVNLQKLRLNSNQITNFDGRILVQLERLEELELRNNKLTYLLDDVFTRGQGPFLQELKHVDLAQNRLDRVPPFITYLPKLRVLALAYNGLTNIDMLFIPDLVRIETLDVSNNKLEGLSDDIAILENLQHLNCECNNIANFPTILGYMKSLKNIQVYGNPIKNIRREIVSKGSKHILEFLQSRHPVPFQPVKNAGPTGQQQQQQYYQEQQQQQQYYQEKPQPQWQRGQQGQTAMEIEENFYEKKSMNKVTENPYRQAPQEKPVQQQINRMNYQPDVYQSNQRPEEKKESYEQKGPGQAEIRNEIKALDEAIGRIEHELQENFTLSTTLIMKKKKEANALRSRRNMLAQQLG